MSEQVTRLRRTIRGGRPYFFDDPATDKVLNMVVTLASEVWTLRERLAALESIGTRRGTLSPGEVDAYDFTPEEESRLAELRKEFIENLFRVLPIAAVMVYYLASRAIGHPQPAAAPAESAGS